MTTQSIERSTAHSAPGSLEKAPSCIEGLDAITMGGLPRGRPTLVCGGPGAGKTLFALEFLMRGAIELGEPAVFVAFEERPEDIATNVASLGFDLADLEARGLLVVDHIEVERSQIAEAGAFDLEGLFIRLKLAVDSVGAKRVAIDTLEAIFGGFTNQALLRDEIRRLFRWLKEEGLTVVITGERGSEGLTRHNLEEYVSDCVILLTQRVENQLATRRLRIIKYRGSLHGTNEYPFLIDEEGMSVLPISSAGLTHGVSTERISSGIPALDEMMNGKGYFRGSSILVSGTAGSGKTSMANILADATCRRGERCLYFAFEESSAQIIRNMRSIGMDLDRWVDEGLLQYHASRPTVYGLEMHLVKIHKLVDAFEPSVVIIDPFTNLTTVGTEGEVKTLLVRLLDFLKLRGITALYTSLTSGGARSEESTDIGISSLIDSWILVRDIESHGERTRGLYILKSRGMAHSHQIREFVFTPAGIDLRDVYLGPGGVLTGSSRLAREAEERAAADALEHEIEGYRSHLAALRKAMKARRAALDAELQAEEQELERSIEQRIREKERVQAERLKIAQYRGVHAGTPPQGSTKEEK